MDIFKIAKVESYVELVQDSRFIGYCFPIESKAEAERCLDELQHQHSKATHICWAYRLLLNQQILYYLDDAGEPRGSAGQPILHALERRNLVNTWCGIVRYFGGTKLGLGGLIRAYGRIAGKTLDQAGWLPIIPTITVEVHLNPVRTSQLYNYLKHNRWQYSEEYADAEVQFNIQIPENKLTALAELVQAWGGRLLKK